MPAPSAAPPRPAASPPPLAPASTRPAAGGSLRRRAAAAGERQSSANAAEEPSELPEPIEGERERTTQSSATSVSSACSAASHLSPLPGPLVASKSGLTIKPPASSSPSLGKSWTLASLKSQPLPCASSKYENPSSLFLLEHTLNTSPCCNSSPKSALMSGFCRARTARATTQNRRSSPGVRRSSPATRPQRDDDVGDGGGDAAAGRAPAASRRASAMCARLLWPRACSLSNPRARAARRLSCSRATRPGADWSRTSRSTGWPSRCERSPPPSRTGLAGSGQQGGVCRKARTGCEQRPEVASSTDKAGQGVATAAVAVRGGGEPVRAAEAGVEQGLPETLGWCTIKDGGIPVASRKFESRVSADPMGNSC